MPFKRKMPSNSLERRVRPRREEKGEPEAVSGSDGSESEDDGPTEQRINNTESGSEDDSQGAADDYRSQCSEANDEPPKADLSSVSFGALARAQACLPKPPITRKQPPEQEPPSPFISRTSKSTPTTKKRTTTVKRSSKHAPQEQTSKRPVTRMREIIPDTRRKARDPRFDPLVGKVDESRTREAYAFLDEYRESEMAELRAEAKRARNPLEKEELKRRLMSMESRKKAQEKKEEQGRLLAEHRQREKELVAQGKAPFYLKRSEQRKQLLLSQYGKMSKGQVDRAIERKRKKVVGKEKKELDQLVRRR